MKLAIMALALGMTSASYGGNISSISINLQPASGAPGSTVIFSGTVTNNTGVEQFLNDANAPAFGVGFTYDLLDYFFVEAPLSLLGLQTSPTFQMFSVTIPGNAGSGPYTGSFSIAGGPGVSDQTLLGSTTASLTVTPEPATVALMFAGLAGMAFARRKQSVRS